MDNENEQKSYNREVQQDTYTDANGHHHTQVTRTTETANSHPNSYSDGYVNGKTSERLDQEKNLAARDNKNAAGGLLVGILLTGLVGLTAGAFWFFNQRHEAVKDNVVPVAVPTANSSPSPQTSQAPQKQTTIIERTRDVPVPVERTRDVPVPIFVPQPQISASPAPTQAPRQNSTSSQPTANPTPSTQPNSRQSQTNKSSTPTQQTRNNSTSSTSPINPESQTDTKTDSSSSSSSNDSTSSSGQ